MKVCDISAHYNESPLYISSVESQKGIIIIQQCSTEKQKGTIAV